MNALVAFALRQRVLVVALLVLVLGAGVASFLKLNIEAYPDPVPPLVDIVTQSSGQSAEEIERYITIPIEVQMAGIPHVQAIRTISLFGLSDVKVQFTYEFTYERAEQWVINRLAQLPALPNGAQPTVSPTSPIGTRYGPVCGDVVRGMIRHTWRLKPLSIKTGREKSWPVPSCSNPMFTPRRHHRTSRSW